jgi:hypothetical protein
MSSAIEHVVVHTLHHLEPQPLEPVQVVGAQRVPVLIHAREVAGGEVHLLLNLAELLVKGLQQLLLRLWPSPSAPASPSSGG